MAFLGKLGKYILPAVGGLAGSALLPGIGTALGTSLFAGAAGDALATGIGSGVGGLASGGGLKNAALDAITGGAGEYLTGAAQATDAAIGNGLSSGSSALGIPSSTAAAPAATAAGSASQVALDPNLIDNAASGIAGAGAAGQTATTGGLTDVGLNAGAGGLVGDASAAGLPASTAATASAPTGLLGKAQAALGSPLGRAATTLAPVAYQAYKGNQVTPQQKALQAQAEQLGAQGAQLQQDLTTGQLPAGLQASLDQAKQDAIASIKADFANRGLSGSTMEQQALQAAETNASSAAASQLQSLFQTGLSETNSSSALYDKIMQTNISQDKDLSTAIAAAVGSMGSSKPQQTNAT